MQTKNPTSKRRDASRKSPRRRSREFAVQGLYQWLLAATDPVVIAAELGETDDFGKSDVPYFRALLNGAIEHASELEVLIAPFLDRPVSGLSPIERGILLLAGYELKCELEVPYRVVINEAVELAKVYGGTDGHKYVNGVLDKLAGRLRELEQTADRGAAGDLMNQPDEQNVRKRILMFYFAAGLNLCMSVYVFAAGAAQGGTLIVVAFIFLAFAALNFYVARMLRKRLEAFVRSRQPL